MHAPLIPYGHQWIDEDDIKAVTAVLWSDWLTTGPAVPAFEAALAAKTGAAHAVAVSSGTAALHAAVAVSGVGPGDEVITSPLTFAATANAVLYCGGTPVFADIGADLNLDPAAAAAAVTKRTKALLPVHFAGQPADLAALAAIAEGRNLAVIEDAAHALGAAFGGKPVGSGPGMAAFSFHPVKHITTGEGGAVTTQDADLAARLRRFRNHGISTEVRERQEAGAWTYEMVELGFNYRITDIGCALGQSQLKKLAGFLRRRKAIAARYLKALKDHPALELPVIHPDRKHAWHIFTILLKLDALRADRNRIFADLRARGIGVNVHYIPVYRHPYYVARFGDQRAKFPVTEAVFPRLLTLPLYPAMTDAEVDRVIDTLSTVLKTHRR